MNSHLNRKIHLLGGAGGTGKTTLSAALGIQFACSGFRTVILTVDPAKRLAGALGLRELDHEIKKIEIHGRKHADLYASMLDSRRYFDKVIERFAGTPTQKERILKNPLYRSIVDSMGGTWEYAAMERLLEFVEDPRFDKIVVDTPPSQNAADLFMAPKRLADFLDTSVLRWFQRTPSFTNRLFRQGTKIAIKMMKRILGVEFFLLFTGFLEDLEGMQSGFQNRHLSILKHLQGKETAFWLVSFPSENRFREARSFQETLKKSGIELTALILNQVQPHFPARVENSPNGTPSPMNLILNYFNQHYENQREWMTQFKTAFPSMPVLTVFKQPESIHETYALFQLGEILVS